MKTTHLILTAVATALLAPALHAATLAYNNDDLIIGFRSTASGVTNDILVDIGLASLYRTGTGAYTGASFNLATGSIGADLAAQFGANWYNSSSVYWGVFGTPGAATVNGDAASTLYASHPATGVSAYTKASLATQGNVRNDMNTAEAQYNGATANGTNPNVLVQSTGATFSWASYNNGGQTFSYFNGLEQNFGSGVAGASLDLDRIQPNSAGGPSTDLGTFSISNTGTITYSSLAAVPEPSSVAMLGLGAVGFALTFRRKFLRS